LINKFKDYVSLYKIVIGLIYFQTFPPPKYPHNYDKLTFYDISMQDRRYVEEARKYYKRKIVRFLMK
jgi:hypothetical protein